MRAAGRRGAALKVEGSREATEQPAEWVAPRAAQGLQVGSSTQLAALLEGRI